MAPPAAYGRTDGAIGRETAQSRGPRAKPAADRWLKSHSLLRLLRHTTAHVPRVTNEAMERGGRGGQRACSRSTVDAFGAAGTTPLALLGSLEAVYGCGGRWAAVTRCGMRSVRLQSRVLLMMPWSCGAGGA